jgi:hypothetical protein
MTDEFAIDGVDPTHAPEQSDAVHVRGRGMVAVLSIVLIGFIIAVVGIAFESFRGAHDDSPAYSLRFPLPTAGRSQAQRPVMDTPSEGASSPVALPEEDISKEAESKPGTVQTRVADPADRFALPIAFDLAATLRGRQAAGENDVVIVRKVVVRNGVELGPVTIQVDPDGAIEMETAELASLIASVDGPLAESLTQSQQPRTSFRSLRNRGILINYDPIRDQIVLQDKS